MRESDVQDLARLALAQDGLTMWRQNTGQAWAGDVERLPDGSVLIRNPRPLRAGLCPGSSDLVGFKPVRITEAMVGRLVAVFTVCEIKSERGRLTDAQKNFLAHVRAGGGISVVARSAGDAIRGVKEWITAKQ